MPRYIKKGICQAWLISVKRFQRRWKCEKLTDGQLSMCVRFGYYNYFVLFVVIVCSLWPSLCPWIVTNFDHCSNFYSLHFTSKITTKDQHVNFIEHLAQWPLEMPHRKVLRSNIRDTLQKETTLSDWKKGANFLKGCPDE